MQFHDKENPQKLKHFYQENKGCNVSLLIPCIWPSNSTGYQRITKMNH